MKINLPSPLPQVLHTVGKKLENFNCSQEFVKAMSAALKGKTCIFLAIHLPNMTHITAHKSAYGASVLYQDISPSNILQLTRVHMAPVFFTETLALATY